MLITPCGLHTQLSSLGLPGVHSTRLKLMRHSVPGCGCGNGLAGREGFPRIGDLDGPAMVVIARVVERAVEGHSGPETGNVPAVVRVAVLVVRLVEEEIPAGIEGVDLKLVVAGGGGKRLDEDLEVVVAEDDRIVLGEAGLEGPVPRVQRRCTDSGRRKASSRECENAVWAGHRLRYQQSPRSTGHAPRQGRPAGHRW